MGAPKHKRISEAMKHASEGTKSKKRRPAPKKVAQERKATAEQVENCRDTEKTQLGSRASVPSVLKSQPLYPDIQVGNVHDNTELLFEVKFSLKRGDIEGAFDVLQVLDRHVQASPDPKNKNLEPEIQRLYKEIAEASQKARFAKNNVDAVCLDKQQTSRNIDSAERAHNRIYLFKQDLFDINILLTAFVFSLAFLVQEIKSHFPFLETRPVTVVLIAVAALSIGFIGLHMLRSKKEDISTKNSGFGSAEKRNEPSIKPRQPDAKKASKSAVDGDSASTRCA